MQRRRYEEQWVWAVTMEQIVQWDPEYIFIGRVLNLLFLAKTLHPDLFKDLNMVTEILGTIVGGRG